MNLCPLIIALATVFAVSPALAQLVSTVVSTDLDGDGADETLTLIDTGTAYMDMTITGTAQGNLTASGIVWTGTMIGQQPELYIAPDDTVQVISMNDSVGRDLWKLSLSVGFVDGVHTVVAYTYSWRDGRNARAHGGCEVDLLTGEGVAIRGNRDPRAFQSDVAALPVTVWRAEDFTPHRRCLK